MSSAEEFDWQAIASGRPQPTQENTGEESSVGGGQEPGPVVVQQDTTPPSGGASLPPFPPQSSIIVGRLPIQGDTGKAIIQLPEAVKDVHCAFTVANTGVLSDCYRNARNVCVPAAVRSRPLNDREFEVILDGGDYTAKGLGWQAGAYPGAAPTTRTIGTGVPYGEILAVVGIDCGCGSEDWANDNQWA